MDFNKLTSKNQETAFLSEGSMGEFIFLPFLASGFPLFSLTCGSFFHANNVKLSLSHCAIQQTLSLTLKDACDYSGPTCIIQDTHPLLRSVDCHP